MAAQLETRRGSRLLHRTTHGVTPTEIGALYDEKCKLIAHHVEEAETVAALLQSQVKLQGALRISTVVAFGRRVSAPPVRMVMQFMRLDPRLQIDLSFEDRHVSLVERGIDVAIRMGRLADSTLGARYLGVNPWVLVASPDYLRQRGTSVEPTDLTKHDALVYSTVQGDARWQFTGTDGRVLPVAVAGPKRSNSLSALLAAARDGMGVAALPSDAAADALRSGAVQPLLTEWSLPIQEIHAVYPSPRLVPAKVSSLVAWLQGQFVPQWWAASTNLR